jgi:hypothetical protein
MLPLEAVEIFTPNQNINVGRGSLMAVSICSHGASDGEWNLHLAESFRQTLHCGVNR